MRMAKKVEFQAGDEGLLKSDDDKENVFIMTAEMGDSQDPGNHKVIQGNEYNLILTRVISGPRLDFTLLELQGRIYNRKGVIPTAIIQNFDDMEFVPQNDDRSFLKDVYFRLSIIDRLLENTKYLARFYVKKTDEEDQAAHDEQDTEVEYVRQPDSERLPPIRSQARGLVSRDQMDLIDGIQFIKPVCPSVSVWGSQNPDGCNPQGVSPPLTVNNALQADCFDAVTAMIFEAALRSGLQKPPSLKGVNSDRSLSVTAQQTGEQTIPVKDDGAIADTTGRKNANRSLRKSIKKRLGSFFAAIFGCTRRQDGRND